MTDHAIEKPRLFISHASSDGDFANAVKQEIEKVFADGVSVFSTSSPGDIAAGRDWLQDIEEKLKCTQAVIVIITPVSIERPWVWFEIGATWLKGRTGDCRIYPMCAPEVNIADLPSPLDRLQALSMGKAIDLKLLFEALIIQFGFGRISSFRASNIISRIPKYKDVRINEVDVNDRPLYSGPYSGYSDEELMEVIDTKLIEPDNNRYRQYTALYREREDLIHNGKLLHFRKVDRDLQLPPGTAKRLLVTAAEPWGLEPQQVSDNIVRFECNAPRGTI